jgi:hypothetical protein
MDREPSLSWVVQLREVLFAGVACTTEREILFAGFAQWRTTVLRFCKSLKSFEELWLRANSFA